VKTPPKPIIVWKVQCTDHRKYFRNETRAEQYAILMRANALEVLPVAVECTKDGIVDALNRAVEK